MSQSKPSIEPSTPTQIEDFYQYERTISAENTNHIKTYASLLDQFGARSTIDKDRILKCMPPDASGVFHVFDRRVNLDMHPSSTSMYALSRSWVQDDPDRVVLRDVEAFMKATSVTPKDDQSPETTPTPTETATIDIISELNNGKDLSVDKLRNELLGRAKQVHKKQQQSYKHRLRSAWEKLQRRGILLVSPRK